jgi:glyoxylase-like metal-dependent hydrolase (beta-lactamase superfamily II)
VLGPEQLPPATVVAQAGFAGGLDPDGIRAALAGLESSAGIERHRAFEPPLPDVTFEQRLGLRVGALELALEHAPGHSANMLTLHEPVSGALWAADVLSDVEIPSVIDDLERYERTLERIAAQDVRSLVPGHGTRTDERAEIRRRLDEDRRYLADLRRAISDAVGRGSSLAEAVAAAGTISLRRSDGDEEIHRLNSEKLYADLGGDADPAQVGYERAWRELVGR